LTGNSKADVVSDAVEAGVTAIACQLPDNGPCLADNILAATPSLKQTGVSSTAQMVETIAPETAVRLVQEVRSLDALGRDHWGQMAPPRRRT
jgi:hypothetical protein